MEVAKITTSKYPNQINTLKKTFPTIEDFFIKEKPQIVVPEKILQDIDKHMQKYCEQQMWEEQQSIQESKKIFLVG